jgi:hypothetical protein
MSSSGNVMLSSAFDPAAIVFSSVEKTRKGGKIVYLGTGATGKDRIVLQTPPMAMPFGVTPYQEASTGEIQSYSVDVSFRTGDVDPRVAEFQKKIKDLDDVLIDAATKNSADWFGKKMSRDLVSEFYRRLLKENPNYAPILKMKVSVDSHGEPGAQFFDENRAPVSIDYLTKGSTVKMIAELSSVWFVNKTFGATFRLVQAAVVSKPNRLQGFSFVDDDGDSASGAADPKEPEQPMEL